MCEKYYNGSFALATSLLLTGCASFVIVIIANLVGIKFLRNLLQTIDTTLKQIYRQTHAQLPSNLHDGRRGRGGTGDAFIVWGIFAMLPYKLLQNILHEAAPYA